MLNMLRADVYRLLHTKGFWVLQGVMVGVDFVHILAGFLNHHLPGTVAQVFQKGNDQLYIYYILPIILIVLGADFKYHTLKNIISEGLTFSKYIFFKLASYGFVIFIIILECYLLPCFFFFDF